MSFKRYILFKLKVYLLSNYFYYIKSNLVKTINNNNTLDNTIKLVPI